MKLPFERSAETRSPPVAEVGKTSGDSPRGPKLLASSATAIFSSIARLITVVVIATGFASDITLGQDPRDQSSELFPLTRDRFGTLGAPNSKEPWDVLGAHWFKAGDCYWQGGDWVPQNRVQTWLLVRPRMYFTGNNRVWNPPPKPPKWDYRNKTLAFLEQNKDRIGIIALGNSICFADIESGYYDIDEYVKWYHDFHQFVHRLNPRIKIAPGDLQSAWGGLQGTEQLEEYMTAYKNKYGEPMPIGAVGLHCYITGNKPPDWAKPEVISVETFKQKIRIMRTFMKRIGLQDTAFVITEMGVFNHHCEPRLSDARLFKIMKGAIDFMEGPEGVDKELGMPSDKYRLVQKWSYSAFPHLVRDGRLTPRGKVYNALAEKYARQ